jgi:DNA invertase Pin-like site-specific DNA recombinase
MTGQWSQSTSAEEAYRRAAGRRAHNLRRQLNASYRRAEVVRLLALYGLKPGVRARIASELGVHPTTIGRDLKIILDHLEPSQTGGAEAL